MQLTTARRDLVVEGRKQQAPAAAAGEPERPETCRIDAVRGGEHPQRHQVVGQHRAGERLAQGAGGLGQRVLVPARRRRRTAPPRWAGALLLPQRVLRLQQRGQPRRGTGQVEPPATPGEGVVHQDRVAPTGQLVRRSATGVVRGAEPGSARTRAGPEVDQLLGADRAHPAVTVHDRGRPGAGCAGRRPGAAARRWCPGRSRPTSAVAGSARRPGVRCPRRPRSAGPASRRRPSTRPSAVLAAIGAQVGRRRRGPRPASPRSRRSGCGQCTASLRPAPAPRCRGLSILGGGRSRDRLGGGSAGPTSAARRAGPARSTGTDAVVKGGVR